MTLRVSRNQWAMIALAALAVSASLGCPGPPEQARVAQPSNPSPASTVAASSSTASVESESASSPVDTTAAIQSVANPVVSSSTASSIVAPADIHVDAPPLLDEGVAAYRESAGIAGAQASVELGLPGDTRLELPLVASDNVAGSNPLNSPAAPLALERDVPAPALQTIQTQSPQESLDITEGAAALATNPAAAGSDGTGSDLAQNTAKESGAKSDRVKRADAKNADGTYGKSHIDPVKENGPIFVGWPRPKLALVFSGAQQGFIEPCGCAGLENQKGGMSRRHQLLKQLKADRWPVAAFDAGGLIKSFGRQQELKYAASVDALKIMGYNVAAFGADDLRLPADRLLESASAVGEGGSPFVATNTALYSFDDQLVSRARVVAIAGMKLGVMAVVGDEEQRNVRNDDIQFKPAATAVAEMLPELKKARCDKLILLAHSSLKEATELAKKFPEFHFVATTGGADEPPAQPTQIGKTTQLIEVGHKGMFCVVVGLYDDKTSSERYQRVPLDARFGESLEMKQVLADYQNALQSEGFAGLGVKSATHPSGQSFVGSAACAECHTAAIAIWNKTPHAHATQTLLDLDPQRHFDPECLSCHATGWEPQRYYPFKSGYLDLKRSAHLVGNGCENCHGPGSKHVAAESGEIDVTDKMQKELRAAMRLTKAAANAKCLECHDGDNSPDYKFETYWPKVEHKGKN